MTYNTAYSDTDRATGYGSPKKRVWYPDDASSAGMEAMG